MTDAAVLRMSTMFFTLVAMITGSWLPFASATAFAVVWSVGCIVLSGSARRASVPAAAAA